MITRCPAVADTIEMRNEKSGALITNLTLDKSDPAEGSTAEFAWVRAPIAHDVLTFFVQDESSVSMR